MVLIDLQRHAKVSLAWTLTIKRKFVDKNYLYEFSSSYKDESDWFSYLDVDNRNVSTRSVS